MSERNYDLNLADCAIFEPEPTVRRLLRDLLAHLGFKRAEAFGDIAELRAGIGTRTPDLLVADAAAPDAAIFPVIQALRQDDFGTNPFVLVIVTTFNPTTALLSRATNAGADALLVKPLSLKQIKDRVATLIDTPRRFVVTADYIGPDRRTAPRHGGGTLGGTFEVPNTLRLKATGAGKSVADAVSDAARAVEEKHIVRLAFRAAFLIRFAIPGLAAGAGDRGALDHLLRVPDVLRELQRRLPHREESAPPIQAAHDGIRTLGEELERVRGAGAAGEALPDLRRLDATALDILTEVSPPPHERRTLEAEVASAVGAYRSRLEQIAAAKTAEGPQVL